MHLLIERTWDDHPVEPDQQVHLTLVQQADCSLHLRFEAPFAHDPPPPVPAGCTDRLWEHEVVELMLLGADERYLELEFGPGGHWLALQLHGVRRVVGRPQGLAYRARVEGDRWWGEAVVPADWIPLGWDRLNAFAIRGEGLRRRWLAWRPAGGDLPDFHRLEVFGRWEA
jgi:hypothetical protein